MVLGVCSNPIKMHHTENHLGTLVVALPSDFEGGKFILRKSGGEMTFDWSTSGRKDHPCDLHWVFFYADIEHEVLPVKTGYRLTVSCHIFGVRKSSKMTKSKSIFQYKLTPL